VTGIDALVVAALRAGGSEPLAGGMATLRRAVGCGASELRDSVRRLRFRGAIAWDSLALSPSMLAAQDAPAGEGQEVTQLPARDEAQAPRPTRPGAAASAVPASSQAPAGKSGRRPTAAEGEEAAGPEGPVASRTGIAAFVRDEALAAGAQRRRADRIPRRRDSRRRHPDMRPAVAGPVAADTGTGAGGAGPAGADADGRDRARA
jgi:hypothetical protein